jgi:hypothetical protein
MMDEGGAGAESMRTAAEELPLALQKLPAHSRWALADSAVLQAAARGNAARFGKRGSKLRSLIGVSEVCGLTRALLFFVGLRTLVGLLLKQNVVRTPASNPCPPFLFVGFGAGAEEPLFLSYAKEHPNLTGSVDQLRPDSFAYWHRVGLGDAIRELSAAVGSAMAAAAKLPTGAAKCRLDFLTSTGIRVAHYAFTRAWFEKLRAKSPDLREVAFLSPDTPAFSAVDARIPTRYIQHGLIRHSLVLPSVDRIDALTPDEARHFRRRVPSAKVELQAVSPRIEVRSASRDVLVASIYAPLPEIRRCETFLEWALSQGWTLRLRPHPREDRAYWREAVRKFRVSLEDQDASMHAALARLRPRMVVSWYSTALADALAAGLIPVTVCTLDDPNVQDMVYPLFSRCLRWPDEQVTIASVMHDDDAYRRELARLRQGWDTAQS